MMLLMKYSLQQLIHFNDIFGNKYCRCNKGSLYFKMPSALFTDISDGPSLQQESARRKVDNDVKEFWYYLRSELHKLQSKSENSSLRTKIDMLLNMSTYYQK